MKTKLLMTLGLLVAFAGGFASGFIFHKKISDVEFEEVSMEEMNRIEKGLQEKEAPKDRTEKVIEKYPSVQDLPEDPDKMRIALQGKTSYLKADEEAKTAYAKIWSTVKGYSDEDNANDMPVESIEEGFDENFLEMLEEEEVSPGQTEPPHQIDLAAFYNERSEYDKITIDWYEPDDTYLDEKEEVIGDIRTYVGDLDIPKIFREINPDTDDPDVCFIRNEQYGTDYEIIRHHISYHETVGGEEA